MAGLQEIMELLPRGDDFLVVADSDVWRHAEIIDRRNTRWLITGTSVCRRFATNWCIMNRDFGIPDRDFGSKAGVDGVGKLHPHRGVAQEDYVVAPFSHGTDAVIAVHDAPVCGETGIKEVENLLGL